MEAATETEFDMESAQATLSNDLFPSSESEPDEVEETEIVEEIEETEENETTEETENEPDDESNEETTDETHARQAPQSWKKEMHEAFNSLDPTVQDYIEQREQEMRDGLEKDRNDTYLGRSLRESLSPYSEFIRSQGSDEITAARNLMDLHYKLATSPDNMKAVLFDQLATYYGLAKGEQQEVDPQIKQLQEELYGIKNVLSASAQRSQQEQHQKVVQDVEKFASDPKHSYFDDVSEDIAGLIRAGYSLEDAYEKAVWANPVTRKKEVERLQKQSAIETQERKKQEAEKAKKAKSVNVRTRDTKHAPTEPLGTMDDTMREIYREIQNRS